MESCHYGIDQRPKGSHVVYLERQKEPIVRPKPCCHRSNRLAILMDEPALQWLTLSLIPLTKHRCVQRVQRGYKVVLAREPDNIHAGTLTKQPRWHPRPCAMIHDAMNSPM